MQYSYNYTVDDVLVTCSKCCHMVQFHFPLQSILRPLGGSIYPHNDCLAFDADIFDHPLENAVYSFSTPFVNLMTDCLPEWLLLMDTAIQGRGNSFY